MFSFSTNGVVPNGLSRNIRMFLILMTIDDAMMLVKNDNDCEGQTTRAMTKASRSSSADQLDNRIVAACNELMKLKVLTSKQKVEHRNERASLLRAMQQHMVRLDGRLRTSRHTNDLTEYQAACDRAFNEDGVNIPAFASLRQAQLCLNNHNMTVLEHQIAILKQQRKQEISLLESERNKLMEENATSEVLLLNQIVHLEREIRDLQAQIAATAATASTISLSSSSSSSSSTEHGKDDKQCPTRKKSSDSSSTVDTELEEDGEEHNEQQPQQPDSNSSSINLLNRWTPRFFQTATTIFAAAPTRPTNNNIVETVVVSSNIR